MTAEKLTRIISGDTHLEIDSKRWVERVPAKYRDRVPHTIRLPDGADAWMVEGAPLQDVVFGLYAGKGRKEFRPFKQTYESSAGTGPAEQRLAEQDRDGVAGEVLFPGVNGPPFWRKVRDDECYLAIVRAYNSFLAEEYCPTSPDRLLGVGVIPWTGVQDAIAEMTYCREKGLRAIALGVYPNGGGAPAEEDDEFWAAALDMETVVTVHIEMDRSQGGQTVKMIDMADTSERGRRVLPNYAIITQQVSAFARNGAFNVMQMAMRGVFDRFPQLKIFFAENQIGWLPNFLEMADLRYHRHAHWVQEELGWQPPKRLPSEYAREHCSWGFQEDRTGVLMRDLIGVDSLIWATDFPHQESEWPESKNVINIDFEGVPLDEVKKMTCDNISKMFGLPVPD